MLKYRFGLQVTLIALLCHAGTLSAAGISGIDLQYINDSNPAKAEFDRDIEAVGSVRGRISVDLFSKELTNTDFVSSGISLGGVASYEHNLDISALGESQYRISLGGFHENKRRRGLPFYRYSLSLGYVDSETQIRDSTALGLSVSVNHELAPFFDTTVGLLVEKREAETEVFDTIKTQLFATANFSPVARFVLRAGLRYVIGDEVSTATPTLEIVNTAAVIESDPAFGGVDANRFAYLIDANSVVVETGFGYEMSNLIETNLLYRFISTDADGDISYERSLLELTLSLNF
ncbi:MAG: hypothetical protein V3U76_00865 [Granulosicoccus sp.]